MTIPSERKLHAIAMRPMTTSEMCGKFLVGWMRPKTAKK
jgi:hypothetical protein